MRFPAEASNGAFASRQARHGVDCFGGWHRLLPSRLLAAWAAGTARPGLCRRRHLHVGRVANPHRRQGPARRSHGNCDCGGIVVDDVRRRLRAGKSQGRPALLAGFMESASRQVCLWRLRCPCRVHGPLLAVASDETRVAKILMRVWAAACAQFLPGSRCPLPSRCVSASPRSSRAFSASSSSCSAIFGRSPATSRCSPMSSAKSYNSGAVICRFS